MKTNSATISPNFLVIGGQKCATTWLDNCLRQHEQVFLPSYKHKKEVNFFDKYFDRGVEWYEQLFEEAAACDAVGEVSTHYISNPLAAERIFNYKPDLKLVLLVRNPIERAFSHYKMILNRKGKTPSSLSFKDCYQNFPGVIDGGRYYEHLARFLKLFPASQIKVVLFDNIRSDPRRELTDLLDFLGVQSGNIREIDFELDTEKKNVSTGFRFPKLYRVFGWTFKKLDELEWYWPARQLKKLDWLVKRFNSKAVESEISEEDRRYLSMVFREDVSRLSDWLKLPLKHWLEP